MKHDMIPSTLGHGNTMCRNCRVTDLEAAAIGMVDCPGPASGGSTFKSAHEAGQDIGDSFGRGMGIPERQLGCDGDGLNVTRLRR